MPSLEDLRVRIYADGADLEDISRLAANSLIRGFTTNPTLMRKANVRDYRSFALDVLSIVGSRPVSFEVFSDDFPGMEAQAHEVASWGGNVYVKIPVTNTRGDFSGDLIQRLAKAGVQVNVTAILAPSQIESVVPCLWPDTPSIVSVFAGRIADTGRDPVPMMAQAVEVLKSQPKAQLIWASPRELLNIFQADSVGCHIITATSDVLAKLQGVGKDLALFSLETVRMFRQDAVEAGYIIDTSQPILVQEKAGT